MVSQEEVERNKKEREEKEKQFHPNLVKQAIEECKDNVLKESLVFPKTVLSAVFNLGYSKFKESEKGKELIEKILTFYNNSKLIFNGLGIIGIGVACIIEANMSTKVGEMTQDNLKNLISEQLNIFGAKEKILDAIDDLETFQNKLITYVYEEEEKMKDLGEYIKRMELHCTTLKNRLSECETPTKLLMIWAKCATFIIVTFAQLAILKDATNPNGTNFFQNAINYSNLYIDQYHSMENIYKSSKMKTLTTERPFSFGGNTEVFFVDKELNFKFLTFESHRDPRDILSRPVDNQLYVNAFWDSFDVGSVLSKFMNGDLILDYYKKNLINN